MRTSPFIAAAALCALAMPATAQEIVAPSGVVPTQPAQVASPIPGGVPIHEVMPPDVPQPPGSSIAFVPEGTPLVATPQTSLQYAPVSSTGIAIVPQHQTFVTTDANGDKMEIDSDNTVYKIFPDGSKVAADNGMHHLADGTVVMVKNGVRVQ